MHSTGIRKTAYIGSRPGAAVRPITDSLTSWQGLAMLCLYAAVALAAGCWALARRDA
jgi:hypothetical protein